MNVIYAIKNIINNKIYIGSSNNYKLRWGRHKSNLKHNKHDNIHLQRAWNKYGEETFKFDIIEELSKNNILLEKEQFYMDKYKSYDFNFGYNINPIADKPPSPKGRIITDEYRENMRKAQLGHFVSEETKQKMSRAHMGKKKPRTKEWQEKIVKSRHAGAGYGCSKETKEKIRQTLLGRKTSEETKLKISIALKKVWKER